MYTALTVIHVLACMVMIGVVLLQQGKGADMGAVFGGSSQTLFGSSGAGNFLTRMTAAVAGIFFVTSLALAYGSASRVTTTIFDDAPLAEPADGGAAAPEGAPAAAPAPQADAAPAAEGGGVAVVESGSAAGVQVEAEVKDAGAAVADAPQAAAGTVAEDAKAAGEAVKAEADAAAAKAEGAAEAVVGAEVEEAPGQVDPVPPAAVP